MLALALGFGTPLPLALGVCTGEESITIAADEAFLFGDAETFMAAFVEDAETFMAAFMTFMATIAPKTGLKTRGRDGTTAPVGARARTQPQARRVLRRLRKQHALIL